jgi:hypothetical protein
VLCSISTSIIPLADVDVEAILESLPDDFDDEILFDVCMENDSQINTNLFSEENAIKRNPPMINDDLFNVGRQLGFSVFIIVSMRYCCDRSFRKYFDSNR